MPMQSRIATSLFVSSSVVVKVVLMSFWVAYKLVWYIMCLITWELKYQPTEVFVWILNEVIGKVLVLK